MTIPSLETMLKAGMHFGHQTSRWHPKMKPYIHTKKNGIYIIDLVKTQKLLGEALEFINKIVLENKTILFVGTKSQVKNKLKELAIDIEMPYVHEKWLGGTLTNFSVIKKLIKKYKDLTEQKKTGKLARYTKKEQLNFDREIKKLEFKVGGLINLQKLPDVIFIWDLKKEVTAIKEAKLKNIPVIGVCDTNVNPDNVKYVIPSNDDAIKTIELVFDTIKKTVLKVKKDKK